MQRRDLKKLERYDLNGGFMCISLLTNSPPTGQEEGEGPPPEEDTLPTQFGQKVK